MMRVLHILLGIAILISISFSLSFDSAFAGGPPPTTILYAVDKNSDVLRVLDRTDASTISEVTITLEGETVFGAQGLAIDPTTGKLWAVIKTEPGGGGSGERQLVTINPASGVATFIGVLGDTYAGLEFNSAGTLYGLSGDGADVPESIFILSKTTGSATFVCGLGNGSDGETFLNANGVWYHWSGKGHTLPGSYIMETFDINSCATTNIPLDFSSAWDHEIIAGAYCSEFNQIIVAQEHTSPTTLLLVSTSGVATTIGVTEEVPDDFTVAGLACTGSPIPENVGGKGSSSYQDPNLGDVRHGNGHDNGFCHFANCMNVDGFFNHFPETIVPQGSTQSFTILVHCPRGASTCNHISLGGGLPDSDF